MAPKTTYREGLENDLRASGVNIDSIKVTDIDGDGIDDKDIVAALEKEKAALEKRKKKTKGTTDNAAEGVGKMRDSDGEGGKKTTDNAKGVKDLKDLTDKAGGNGGETQQPVSSQPSPSGGGSPSGGSPSGGSPSGGTPQAQPASMPTSTDPASSAAQRQMLGGPEDKKSGDDGKGGGLGGGGTGGGGGGGTQGESRPSATMKPAASDDENEKKVKELAQKLVDANIDYSWGSGSKEGPTCSGTRDGGTADSFGDYNKTGFDCSHLAEYMMYQLYGLDVPPPSQSQVGMGTDVSASEAKAGDLWFPSASNPPHVAIYIGGNQIIEAQQSGTKVMISDVRDGVFRRVNTGNSGER